MKIGDVVQIPALAKPLSKMNLEELRATAKAFLVAIDEADKKADVIAKIEAAADFKLT